MIDYNDRKIENLPIIRISIDDPKYPENLKAFLEQSANYLSKAFKYLDTLGNIEILDMVGLGICGSRKSSPKGLKIVEDCVEQAVKNKVSIISGNAAGVDFEAHFNCLKFGGNTILVLPEGINHFRIRKGLREFWDWDKVLVISQFEPNDRWQGYRAMQRNLLIVALSSAVIAIEAGETGGTLDSGIETLKSGRPLYVAEYEDMFMNGGGSQILLENGARKLTKSRSSNRANLTDIFEAIKDNHYSNASVRQDSFLQYIKN